MPTKFDCPCCGSTRTKSLAVLYRDGTRVSHSSRKGWLTYRGNFGLYSSTQEGISQTLTSQNATPPREPIILILEVAAVPVVLVATLLGGVYGFVASLLLMALGAVLATFAGADDQALAMTRWLRTFRCGRCGTTYEVIE